MFKTTIEKNQGIRCSWGYLMVEKTINNQDAFGIRWLDIEKKPSEGFKTLLHFMCPSGAVMRPGSTTALLQKVAKEVFTVNGLPFGAVAVPNPKKRPDAAAAPPAKSSKVKAEAEPGPAVPGKRTLV